MIRITRAHEAAMPFVIRRFPRRDPAFVKVAPGEPPRDRDTIAIDERDIDPIPSAFGERDHSGDHEERDAETEANPRQHLADRGKSVDRLHALIVEASGAFAYRKNPIVRSLREVKRVVDHASAS